MMNTTSGTTFPLGLIVAVDNNTFDRYVLLFIMYNIQQRTFHSKDVQIFQPHGSENQDLSVLLYVTPLMYQLKGTLEVYHIFHLYFQNIKVGDETNWPQNV